MKFIRNVLQLWKLYRYSYIELSGKLYYAKLTYLTNCINDCYLYFSLILNIYFFIIMGNYRTLQCGLTRTRPIFINVSDSYEFLWSVHKVDNCTISGLQVKQTCCRLKNIFHTGSLYAMTIEICIKFICIYIVRCGRNSIFYLFFLLD